CAASTQPCRAAGAWYGASMSAPEARESFHAGSRDASGPVADTFGRPLRKLRVSVTDRCNLRCSYCMPREDYRWLPRSDLLDFGGIERLVRVLATLGVERIRLTGGEPLMRPDLPDLVARLVAIRGIRSVALTTNGMLLRENAGPLRAAGLQGLTVSLDSLRPDRFQRLTRREGLADVLAGIDAALEAGFERMKINTVVMRGVNDDEVVDIVDAARARHLEPRFIEYMDVGGATDWRAEAVVPRTELLSVLERRHGPIRQLQNRDGAPADRFVLADGFVVGVISSTSQPFCRSCDRARLTADGKLLHCLYARDGLDVRELLRSQVADAEIADRLAAAWRARDDRGAELRLAQPDRGPWVGVDALVRNTHLEMHTRGG
ncbi:MAG: GTP 3',8-cyclase MoaA, partial [Deltaproteobacteria bacterium]